MASQALYSGGRLATNAPPCRTTLAAVGASSAHPSSEGAPHAARAVRRLVATVAFTCSSQRRTDSAWTCLTPSRVGNSAERASSSPSTLANTRFSAREAWSKAWGVRNCPGQRERSESATSLGPAARAVDGAGRKGRSASAAREGREREFMGGGSGAGLAELLLHLLDALAVSGMVLEALGGLVAVERLGPQAILLIDAGDVVVGAGLHRGGIGAGGEGDGLAVGPQRLGVAVQLLVGEPEVAIRLTVLGVVRDGLQVERHRLVQLLGMVGRLALAVEGVGERRLLARHFGRGLQLLAPEQSLEVEPHLLAPLDVGELVEIVELAILPDAEHHPRVARLARGWRERAHERRAHVDEHLGLAVVGQRLRAPEVLLGVVVHGVEVLHPGLLLLQGDGLRAVARRVVHVEVDQVSRLLREEDVGGGGGQGGGEGRRVRAPREGDAHAVQVLGHHRAQGIRQPVARTARHQVGIALLLDDEVDGAVIRAADALHPHGAIRLGGALERGLAILLEDDLRAGDGLILHGGAEDLDPDRLRAERMEGKSEGEGQREKPLHVVCSLVEIAARGIRSPPRWANCRGRAWGSFPRKGSCRGSHVWRAAHARVAGEPQRDRGRHAQGRTQGLRSADAYHLSR